MKVVGDLSKENGLLQKFNTTSTFDGDRYYKLFSPEKTPEVIFKLVDSTFSVKGKEIDTFIK